jgi:hypothetical protein
VRLLLGPFDGEIQVQHVTLLTSAANALSGW